MSDEFPDDHPLSAKSTERFNKMMAKAWEETVANISAALDDAVVGHVYDIKARSMQCGIYLGDGRFRGIRRKFDRYYLFDEWVLESVTAVHAVVGVVDLNLNEDEIFNVLAEIEQRAYGRTIPRKG